MNSFITNFQSPVEIEDLLDRYEQGEVTNIDMLLDFEMYSPLEWTVSKDAEVGDIVFFMCAKTSKDHMGHVCVQAKEESPEVYEFALREKELYKKYAGNIVAIGKVAKEPFQTEDSGWERPYWKSPWYAEISDIVLLENMVNISEYRDFITVSRTGSITKLTEMQGEKLYKLIQIKNKSLRGI